jgi:hypothetical protein
MSADKRGEYEIDSFSGCPCERERSEARERKIHKTTTSSWAMRDELYTIIIIKFILN